MANDSAVRRSGRGILIFVILALVVGLFCLIFVRPSTASTGPDQVSLHYKGGAFTSKRFSDCIAPSNRVFDGPGDGHFAYPASQSNFVFDTGEGDGGPITFVTKDGIEMTVEGVANFVLNTDCSLAGDRRHDLPGRAAPAVPRADRQPLRGVHDRGRLPLRRLAPDARDLHRPAAGHRDRPGRPGLHLHRALHRPGQEGGLGAVGARAAARPGRPADRRRDLSSSSTSRSPCRSRSRRSRSRTS